MVLEASANESTSLLEALEQSAGQPKTRPFRERAKPVGSVYTISYTSAVVAVYDHDREEAGGLPKSAFLMAAKQEGDETFILLRIQSEARLPAAAANDQTRQEGIEDSMNESPWADRLPTWVRNKMSLHGLECSVLGTFIARDDGTYRYAEDIANYYAVNELMVWKPDAESLDLIVNYQHRSNDIPMARKAAKIGRTRFAAAESDEATKADFRINPTDILKRRTVYLGMSRSGKSNGLKVVAENIYQIRADNPAHRVGQIIFDLSGEYAQDNWQDGKGLHRVHETLGLSRKPEVATYGLMKVEWDPDRTVMKLNFYGKPFPAPWTTVAVEEALEQLTAGRIIINSIMEHERNRYTTAFRDVDLSVPQNAEGDIGTQVRYQRAILAYRTALAAAGLAQPGGRPTLQVRGDGSGSLLGEEITKALALDKNENSDNQTEYHQAAEILRRANAPQGRITWQQLQTVFTALDKFVRDDKSGYQKFDNAYISKSSSGEPWADQRLKAVISIFRFPAGPRTFQIAHEQHEPSANNDFAEAVIEDLEAGKLVIIDQSAGEPEQNQNAAERVMWRILRHQQEKFRSAVAQLDPTKPPDESQATEGHIIIYVEEAHNLLPNANVRDALKTVWAKAAKEGSKYNMGLVLATQAPSTIMREILNETDNWVLSYLNSGTERRFVADYMDFADFIDQIGKVSEQGFVRIRTLSQAYTVPVQLDKFVIEAAPTADGVAQSTTPPENGHRSNQSPL